MEAARATLPLPAAEDFVRFCYRRRRVGWPDLYDEMCLVATRGAFRGMGHSELAEVGIGFSLFDTRQLAELVTRVVAEEQAERARLRSGIRVVRGGEPAPAAAADAAAPVAAAASSATSSDEGETAGLGRAIPFPAGA